MCPGHHGGHRGCGSEFPWALFKSQGQNVRVHVCSRQLIRGGVALLNILISFKEYFEESGNSVKAFE